MTCDSSTSETDSGLRHGANAKVTLNEWRNIRFYELKLSYSSPIDTNLVVSQAKGQWRYIWRSKNSSRIYCGIGRMISFEDISSALKPAAGLRLFVSLAFETIESGCSLKGIWDGFAAQEVVLPQIEICQADNECQLTLRILANQDHSTEAFKRLLNSIENLQKKTVSENFPSQVKLNLSTSKNQWQKATKTVLKRIAEGFADKVVLSRAISFQTQEKFSLYQLLNETAALEESSFYFAQVNENGKAFVGRSPERLLRWQNKKVFVDAIAGTRRRLQNKAGENDSETELIESIKDQREHSYVADFVKEILVKHCDEVEQTENFQLLTLKNVIHMRSQFEGKLKADTSPVSLLNDLHPTPAVCGTPSDLAATLVKEVESFDRGLFAGAQGILDSESGDFCIAIRSALSQKHSLSIFAGAGIVTGSEAELEWEETRLKMKNFTDLFDRGSQDYGFH